MKTYTLYTTHCPKCTVLEAKLKKAQINYETIDDQKEIVAVGQANHILSAPILKIDEQYYDFSNAIKLLKEME